VETSLNYDLACCGMGYKKRRVLSHVTTNYKAYENQYNISYSDGVYDRVEDEFRGFEKVRTTVIDVEKNVTHITEKTYQVKDQTGMDQYNINPLYNQYNKGKILRVENQIDLDASDDANEIITIGKTDYHYREVPVLSGSSEVKFVYPDSIKQWIYDDHGNFLGVDEENGDLDQETSIEIENGMIKKTTEKNYGDPHHDADNIQTETLYLSLNTDSRWLLLPYEMETIDMINNTKIGLTNIYYDNRALEQVSEGKISSEASWNSKGDSAENSFEYDSYGNINKITDAGGLITRFTTTYQPETGIYNKVLKTLPKDETETNYLTETSYFDCYGRLVKSTDVYGDTTYMTYDDCHRVLTVTEPINGVNVVTRQFSYSQDGDYFKAEAAYLDQPDNSEDQYLRVQWYQDGLGRDIQTKSEGVVNGVKKWIVSGKIEFDSMGRTIRTGPVTSINYSQNGFVEKTNAYDDHVTFYEYDERGRLSRTTLPSGLEVENSFEQGVEYFGLNNTIYNRITAITTTTSYDTDGALKNENKSYQDLSGNVVKSESLREDGSYAETRFEYDLHGWSKVVQDNDNAGEKQFNSIGNLMWMKSPDAGKFEYVYNTDQLVTQVKEYGKNEADYRSIHYSYDTKNRITAIEYPGKDNDIQYDYYGTDSTVSKYARGSIHKICKGDPANPYYSVEYTYGQLWINEKKMIDGTYYDTRYDYDVQGRISKVTYPDGEEVVYSYDQGGLLNKIANNSYEYVKDIQYDEYGQRTFLEYGNGSKMTYEYDKKTRLLDEFKTLDKNSNEILKYNYNFDISGNITSITDNVGGSLKSEQNYKYDMMGRLIHADGDYNSGEKSYKRDYKYSKDNLVLSKTLELGKKYDYHYFSNSHALSSVDIINGSTTNTVGFTYDDYGNMTQKKISSGSSAIQSSSYTYDENNRLTTIDDGNTLLSFQYDNKGQRIKKIYEDDLGIITDTTYVNGFYTIVNDRADKSISDGNYIIATKRNNDVNDIHYTHSNHIGSTAAVTDKDGLKESGYLFLPYGELWVNENENAFQPDRMYTAQVFDQESGLYYFNARYYDATIGRFINVDPVQDGTNWYVYCSNNPLSFKDPTGLFTSRLYGDAKVYNKTIGKTSFKNILEYQASLSKKNTSQKVSENVDKGLGVTGIFNVFASGAGAVKSLFVKDGRKDVKDRVDRFVNKISLMKEDGYKIKSISIKERTVVKPYKEYDASGKITIGIEVKKYYTIEAKVGDKDLGVDISNFSNDDIQDSDKLQMTEDDQSNNNQTVEKAQNNEEKVSK
jgi:RHS repeat-associated protein